MTPEEKFELLKKKKEEQDEEDLFEAKEEEDDSLWKRIKESPLGRQLFPEAERAGEGVGKFLKEDVLSALSAGAGMGQRSISKSETKKPSVDKEPEILEEAVPEKEEEKKAPTTLAEGIAKAPKAGEPGKKAPPPPPPPPPTETDVLKERIGKLETKLGTAKDEKKKLRDVTDWGELASLIGRSLTQIGAAQAGLKKGIDMSGVGAKQLIDWDAKRKQIDADYKQEIDEITQERKDIERKIERIQDKEEQDRLRKEDFQNKLKLQTLKLERQEGQAQNKALIKSTKAMLAGDELAIKQSIDEAENSIKLNAGELNKIQDLQNKLKFGVKGKDVEVKEVAADLAAIIGEEAVGESGWFSSLIDKEDALNLLKQRSDNLTTIGQNYQNQLKGLQQGLQQLKRTTPEQRAAAPSAPQRKPGDIIVYQNKKYQLAEDGDTLIPLE